MALFMKIEITILKLVWNHKRPQRAKAILEKKNKFGDIPLLDFKLYYKPTVTKTTWHQHKNRHKDQWKIIESPEINPQVANLTKKLKIYNGERTGSSINGIDKTGLPQAKKMKQDPCLILHTKINLKWIVNLNIRPVNYKTPKIKYRE